MRKVCAKMVPTNLNNDKKASRNEVSTEMLERLKTEPDFLSRVIIGEKIGFWNMTLKWHTPKSPRQKKARISK
jgi:hypothetical protein